MDMKIIRTSLIDGSLTKKIFNKFFSMFSKKVPGDVNRIANFIDRRLSNISLRIISKDLSVMPNQIMMLTFRGEYDCNPKAIAEEILRRNLPWTVYWAARKEFIEKKVMYPKNLNVVRINSQKFYEKSLSSKVIVDNSIVSITSRIPKKKEQYLIETWHGSLGLKRFDAAQNKKWAKKAVKSGKRTDFCISNSSFETNLFKTTFWKDVEICEYGHPRNDILFEHDSDLNTAIRERVHISLNIPDDGKILLYGPTFRDSKDLTVYDIDYLSLKNSLEQRFGGSWYIVTRMHLRIRDYLKKQNGSIDYPDFVIDATEYPDIQDLISVADAGITDYSSWICDFVLTKRPGFIFAKDLKEYYSERGFYYPLETTPFPISENNECLSRNILEFDNEKYQSDCDIFISERGCIEDGYAAKRTVDKIEKIIKSSFTDDSAKSKRYYDLALKYKSKGNSKKELTFLRLATYNGSENARDDLVNYLMKDKKNESKRELIFLTTVLEQLHNNPDVCISVSDAYKTGAGISKDNNAALSWIRKGYSLGSYTAYKKLLSMLWNDATYESHKELYDLIKEHDSENDCDKEYYLGQLYHEGLVTDKDDMEAIRHLELSSNNGNINSKLALFDIIYSNPNYKTDIDLIDLIQPLIRNNDKRGLLRLGQLYQYGIAVDQDYYEAINIYEKAIKAGLKEATYNEIDSLLCINTEDTSKKALKLAESMCKGNDAKAHACYGHVCSNVILPLRDLHKAKHHLLLAKKYGAENIDEELSKIIAEINKDNQKSQWCSNDCTY